MIYAVYVFLNIVLLVIFIITGKNIEQSPKKNFWNLYLPAIISYTLILGARWMRGVDYKHYQDIYNYGLGYEQKLFSLINAFLNILGVDDIGIFFVYSFIFIFLAGFIIQYYRGIAIWLLPLFLFAFTSFDEWFIRQGLGYSFVFLFLKFLFEENYSIKKRFIGCILSILCACSIHSGNVFVIGVIILCYLLCRKPFDYRICIVLFLFSSYYFQYNMDFTYVNYFLNYIQGFDARLDEYIKRGDDWFSIYASSDDYYRRGVIKLFQTLGECAFFYFANMAFKLNKNVIDDYKVKSLIVLFNVYVIGSILGQMFFSVEIPKRVAMTIYILWCFPLAYTLYSIRFSKLNQIQKMLFLCLTFWCYEHFKYIFYRLDGVYYFIWDRL